MRQIKFRAYVRFLREMHEVREMIFDKGTVMIDAYQYGLDRDDAPVMQYTGLQDKKGNDIYEDDVVKYLTHTAHVFWSPQDFEFVHYNEVIGGYAGLSFFKGYKDFEVIGNIHQHPELLEGDK